MTAVRASGPFFESGMMRAAALVVGGFLLLALGLAVAAGAALLSGGISARTEPSRLERQLATIARSFALRSYRARRNPVPPTAEVLAQGRAHFADHCASCHANDGSGDTDLGRSLYPRAPDLRFPATQSLSDGELFAIIEDGVRFTGMPAWGDGSAGGERSSWILVHFIRHLSGLTQEELAEMRALNPKGAGEWQEEEEERRFLEDEGVTSPGAGRKTGHHR